MLGALSTCPATVESHAPYLPVVMVFTHNPHTFTNWQWIFTGATHKNQNTLHTSKSDMVLANHPSLN